MHLKQSSSTNKKRPVPSLLHIYKNICSSSSPTIAYGNHTRQTLCFIQDSISGKKIATHTATYFAICYISSLPQFHDGGVLELMEASQEQHQHLSYQQRTKLFYMVGISCLQN